MNNPKVSKRQGEGGEIKKTQEEPKDDIHNSDNAGVKSGSSGTFEKPEEIAKQVDENDVVREGEVREEIQKHANEQVGGEPMVMGEQPVVMGEQPLENKKILEPPAPAHVEQVKLGPLCRKVRLVIAGFLRQRLLEFSHWTKREMWNPLILPSKRSLVLPITN